MVSENGMRWGETGVGGSTGPCNAPGAAWGCVRSRLCVWGSSAVLQAMLHVALKAML